MSDHQHIHTTIDRQGVLEGLRILRGYIEAGNIEYAKAYLVDLMIELQLDNVMEAMTHDA